MTEEFNKKIMLDNISFLLNESGKKIGELETEACKYWIYFENK